MASDQPDQQATVEVQAQLAATETAASSGHVGIVAAITTPTSKRARPTDRNVPSVRSSTISPAVCRSGASTTTPVRQQNVREMAETELLLALENEGIENVFIRIYLSTTSRYVFFLIAAVL